MWDAAVSPDGKTLLTGGWNDTTRLWNLQTGEMLQNFFATESSTQGVEFTKDGRFFATSGIYGLAVVRDAKSLQIRTRLNASGRDIAVHPNGNWFVVGASDGIHVFKLPPTDVGTSAVGQNEVQKADVTIPEGRGEIRQVTYSSNGRFLASSAASGVVSIWDGENFKPLKTLEMK